MRSSGTSGSSPSFWRAISSLSALCANRAARSPRSGFCEDTSLGQRVVDQCAGNVTPRLSLLLRHDHDIRSDPQRIEHGEEPHHLSRLAHDRRLDHEKVEVAIYASVATATRTEEDHLRLRRYRIRQQTPSTINDLRHVHCHDATVT